MSRGTDPRERLASRDSQDTRGAGNQHALPPKSVEPDLLRDLSPTSELPTEPRRSTETREVHEIRGRTYRLRTSETRAMLEIGKFRAIAQEDLIHFFYKEDGARFRADIENVVRQGLVQLKSVPYEEKGSRTLVALTKQGHRLLTETAVTPRNQTLYHGFVKPREAHHDADLYSLYQKASEKIQRQGGTNLRVILDYELKKRVYHELAKLGEERDSPAHKREVAERHQLQVVRGKIPVPDVRIEYETRDGERARVDLELATGHYRGRSLAEKVWAGFAIYAFADEVGKLRKILDQRELTAEILSL
jgi:hypothetical protein